MKLSDFDYSLPENLIAQQPIEKRDDSRLMIVDRESRNFSHTTFTDVKNFLPEKSLLIVNDTKVIPARLIGRKSTGAKIEVFLLRKKNNNVWETLIKPGKRIKSKTELIFGDGELIAKVIGRTEIGGYLVKFRILKSDAPFGKILAKIGKIPLPPYIKRDASQNDNQRYQTVYAKRSGAVAAPTAGLHFTKDLIRSLKSIGFEFASLTLHVGLGTFQPIKTENIDEHKMHSENFEIDKKTADQINRAKSEGRKVIAVGTTSVRAIESAVQNGSVIAERRDTDIFIFPGYKFQIIDGIITNFHLPKSTLLLLISAFADRDLITKAYETAIDRRYRFYSYGDAMLII